MLEARPWQKTYDDAVPVSIRLPESSAQNVLHLAAYRVSKLVEDKEGIPKSAMGRILRRILDDEEIKKSNRNKRNQRI